MCLDNAVCFRLLSGREVIADLVEVRIVADVRARLGRSLNVPPERLRLSVASAHDVDDESPFESLQGIVTVYVLPNAAKPAQLDRRRPASLAALNVEPEAEENVSPSSRTSSVASQRRLTRRTNTFGEPIPLPWRVSACDAHPDAADDTYVASGFPAGAFAQGSLHEAAKRELDQSPTIAPRVHTWSRTGTGAADAWFPASSHGHAGPPMRVKARTDCSNQCLPLRGRSGAALDTSPGDGLATQIRSQSATCLQPRAAPASLQVRQIPTDEVFRKRLGVGRFAAVDAQQEDGDCMDRFVGSFQVAQVARGRMIKDAQFMRRSRSGAAIELDTEPLTGLARQAFSKRSVPTVGGRAA